MHEFTPWPKTARLFRDVVVTEKIDGTNAGIHISLIAPWEDSTNHPMEAATCGVGEDRYAVTAQSRNRLISPARDNYGFARWVHDNAADLVRILGPGLHFGEWWGRGIQRGYELEGRRFSLFNTARWYELDEKSGTSMAARAEQSDLVGQIDAVPVMFQGTFTERAVRECLTDLTMDGSWAAPGFMNPEGVCIYHTQTRSAFKVTLDNNDAGKWEAA